MRSNKQTGFSLVESMVGMGILAALGLGTMLMSNMMKSSNMGQTLNSELNHTMIEMKNLLSNPQACEANFKNKRQGDSVTQLINSHNEVKFKVSSTVPASGYYLTGIKVGVMDAVRKRTQIIVSFQHAGDEMRAKTVNKYINLFSDTTGGSIASCFDPLNLTMSGAFKKLCWDVDPLNFDASAANDDKDCENNIAHITDQMKMFYCQEIPFFKYNPATGECLPMDAGKSCGPTYLQGFDSAGNLVCYTRTSTNGTCYVSSWSPLAATQCDNQQFTQTNNCGGSRTVQGQRSSRVWGPDPSGFCTGTTVTQTSDCGETQTVSGTSTAPNCNPTSPNPTPTPTPTIAATPTPTPIPSPSPSASSCSADGLGTCLYKVQDSTITDLWGNVYSSSLCIAATATNVTQSQCVGMCTCTRNRSGPITCPANWTCNPGP